MFTLPREGYRQIVSLAISHDGRRLVAVDHGALSILDTATGRSRTLDLKSPVDDEFSLSPDGSSIYFMQSERQGDIWLITLAGAPPVAR